MRDLDGVVIREDRSTIPSDEFMQQYLADGAGNDTFTVPQEDVQQQVVSAMDAAVLSPVVLTVTFTRHDQSGGGTTYETHRIESLHDALCVMLLAMQSYGFTVETLAALDAEDNGESVNSNDIEKFLDGQTYIN